MRGPVSTQYRQVCTFEEASKAKGDRPVTHPIGAVTPAIVGLDVGDRVTHLCALDQDREVLERRRFATTPQATRKRFADRAREAPSFWPAENRRDSDTISLTIRSPRRCARLGSRP